MSIIGWLGGEQGWCNSKLLTFVNIISISSCLIYFYFYFFRKEGFGDTVEVFWEEDKKYIK